MAKWAQFTRYNPDAEWKPYTFDAHFYGASATVYVALSKINLWSDDVAAYAFIRQVFLEGGSSPYLAEDPEAAPSTGWWGGIDKVRMELYLYGPVLARATLLGVYT